MFFKIHTTTLKFHKRIPAAAKQWKAMVAKYVNTKTQHKTKKACVHAASVVTSKCLEDAEVLLDLELLHQHRAFRRNVHPSLEAGVRIHVTATKDLQLS